MSENYFEQIESWKKGEVLNFNMFNDEISGRIPVIKVNKWNDFIDLINDDFFNREENELIFRGQRRFDWGLLPNLARFTSNNLFDEKLLDGQLKIFKKTIRGRIKDHTLILNDDKDSDDEIWAIGQHYGLNTPLLDWSYSPYVALFFAFSKRDSQEEKENPYRSVYIINKSLLADVDIEFVEPKIDMYGRLVNQAGLFIKVKPNSTIESEILDKLYEDEELGFVDNEEIENQLAKYICKIYILNTEENQKDCIQSLKMMNVHYANLFPDLLGAADYCNMISEENYHKRNNKVVISNEIKSVIEYKGSENIGLNNKLSEYIIDFLSIKLNLDKDSIIGLSEKMSEAYINNKVVDLDKNDSAQAIIRLHWKNYLRRNKVNEDDIKNIIFDLLNNLIKNKY